MNERFNFVAKIQSLLRGTDLHDVQLRYGYLSNTEVYSETGKRKFIDSNVDVNADPTKNEVVLIKYDANPDWYGIIQSIEADGLSLILEDIVKSLRRL